MNRTDWQRLRGRHRTRDIRKGLQARMADPFWMMARQWQFGEFKGDDAATPAKVHLTYKSLPIDRFQGYQPNGSPGPISKLQREGLLETLVEGETVLDSPAAVRMSAEAGIQFLRRPRVSSGGIAQIVSFERTRHAASRPGEAAHPAAGNQF